MTTAQATVDPGLLADTFGWDTAFAIRATDVNAAIKRRGSSPVSFAADTSDPGTQRAVHVEGDFADWQITLGGSGRLIHMSTPVTSLIASGTSSDGKPLSFTFGSGTFEIQVELEYVPHTDPPAGSGTFHQLMVKSRPVAAEQVVTVLGGDGFEVSTDPAHVSFDLVADDVKAAMQVWFNDNLGDFEHVFATVNLNRTADEGQFAWLLPTYTSYAYIDGATLDDSILGILCMTDGRSADGLDQEISPNAIPAGSRAGFLIAPERFIVEMLWPSMPHVYEGVEQSDFAPRTDATGLTLAAGPVLIKDLPDDSGTLHTSYLENFELSTSNQVLSIDAVTRSEVSSGIDAYTRTQATYSVQLHDLSPTQQTIYYVPFGDPVPPESWTVEGPGIAIGKIFIDIAAAIAAVAIGVLTEGAGFVIAAVVIGVLVGVAEKVPDMVAAANSDDSPSISLLAFNAIDPLQWSDQKDFDLDQVTLNFSLQMGGTPTFGE